MDAAQALADLTEISSQIQTAVLADSKGRVLASTFSDEERARRVVETAQSLISAAGEVSRDAEARSLAQLEAATIDGSVFVVRDEEWMIAATTSPEPTVGLVFYDLKSCLRSVAAGEGDDGKPRPKAGQVKAEAAETEGDEGS